MDQVEIRNASIDDVAALAELSTQLGYPSSPQQASARLAAIVRSSEHLVQVACSPDGAVVGWVHVFLALRVESDPFAELGGFVVTQQCRGRGIGCSLLEAAEMWAGRQGAKKLRVRSRSTRGDANAFYERLGFTQTKEQHVYDKAIGSSA
jgi:N-acetylglutamate synthase-like GNAT family acetyltransferase